MFVTTTTVVGDTAAPAHLDHRGNQYAPSTVTLTNTSVEVIEGEGEEAVTTEAQTVQLSGDPDASTATISLAPGDTFTVDLIGGERVLAAVSDADTPPGTRTLLVVQTNSTGESYT